MSQGQWNPLPAPPQLPFQPPPQYVPPATSKPSGFYKAVGIVQIVLGGAGLVYSLVSLVTLGFTTKMSPGVYDTMTTAALMTVSGIYVVTGTLLLVTGIGVVKARRWARITGVAYATLSLLDTFSNAALQILVIQPRMTKGLSGLGGMGTSLEAVFIVTALFGVLVSSIIPVTTLIVLGRSGARAELDQ